MLAFVEKLNLNCLVRFEIPFTNPRNKMQGILSCREYPRSNNPARKRPVPWYSGDFMEAVFPLNGSADRIRSVPPGTDSWVEFLAFSGRVPAGNGEFPEGFRRKFME